jgi:hypothetical protein
MCQCPSRRSQGTKYLAFLPSAVLDELGLIQEFSHGREFSFKVAKIKDKVALPGLSQKSLEYINLKILLKILLDQVLNKYMYKFSSI